MARSLATPTQKIGWGGSTGASTSAAQTQAAATRQYAFIIAGACHATADPAKPTVTNSGTALTWVEVADHIYSTGVNPRLRMTVWYADVSAGFTSTTFTVTSTGGSATLGQLSIWADVDLSLLSNFAFNDSPTGLPTVTLGSVSSDSAVFSGSVVSADQLSTGPSGYTLLNSFGIFTASPSIQAYYDVSSPSTSLSYDTSTSTARIIAFAIELRGVDHIRSPVPVPVHKTGTGDIVASTTTTAQTLAAASGQYALVVLGAIHATTDPVKPTISNSGTALTWIEVADHTYSTGVNPRLRMTVFYADVSAGFTSTTFTSASTGASATSIEMSIWTDVDTTYLSNFAFADNTVGDPTITLGALYDSDTAVYTAFVGSSGSGTFTTTPTGYTSLHAGPIGVASGTIGHLYDISSPATTLSYVSGSTYSIGFALELRGIDHKFGTPPGLTSGSSKTTTASSNTANISTAVPVGTLLIMQIASDNSGTTDAAGADDIVSITDTSSNTWTLAYGYRNGQGVAQTGAHASVWYTVVTTEIAASTPITINVTASGLTRARAWNVSTYPHDTGTISVAGTAGAAADGGTDPSATISGLASDDYLWIGCAADENNALLTTPPAGFALVGAAASSGGSANTNISVGAFYSVATATTKTFTPAVVGDAAAVLVAFALSTGPTGNVATTETGSDTTALTGTVAVAGSLTPTETGPDTSAITGTVEPLPTINGSLAITEATTDTAAFNVVAPIQGSMAVAESGSDTAAFDGTLGPLPITASVAAQETGSDTAASDVLAIATGSLNSAETGSDTASLSGTAAVTGTVAATETGSDVAALNGTVAGVGTFAATEAGADAASADIRVIVTSEGLIVETGSDTAALSGTGSVAGTLAVTEIGPDSASFDATVRVAGTLAATETGSDAASAAGSVAVAGSLSVIEVGSDLALFYAGAESIIQANLASNEIGSDTAAFTGALGDLEIVGSLNALESGPDSALVNGTVSVTGTLAVTEIGGDLASFVGGQQQFTFVTLDAQEVGSDTAAFIGTVGGAVVAPEKDRLGTSVTRFEERRHKPRKRAPLAGKPLTDKQIRQLQDKVHEKRRAIWKKPEPKAEERPVVVEPPPPSQAPAELEKARTVVSIAKVQLEFETLRKQREADLAVQQAEIDRQQEAQRLKRVAAEQEQAAKEAEQERISLEALRKQEIDRQEKAARLQEMLAEQERKLKEAEQERARVEKQNAEIARIKKTSETIAHFQRLLAEQEQRIKEVEEERIRVEALHRQNQEVMAVLLS